MITGIQEKPSATLSHFLRREEGVAAIEFAFIAPLLVLFLLGTTQATQSLWAHGKIAQTSSVIGDLVSQETELQTADFGDIMRAAPVLIEPLPVGDLKIQVTAAIACHQNPNDIENSTPQIFVVWSDGWQNNRVTGTGAAPGTRLEDAPTELTIQDGNYIIQTKVDYTYEPPISQEAGYTLDMGEVAYHQPRDQLPVSYPSVEGNEDTRDCDKLLNR